MTDEQLKTFVESVRVLKPRIADLLEIFRTIRPNVPGLMNAAVVGACAEECCEVAISLSDLALEISEVSCAMHLRVLELRNQNAPAAEAPASEPGFLN